MIGIAKIVYLCKHFKYINEYKRKHSIVYK